MRLLILSFMVLMPTLLAVADDEKLSGRVIGTFETVDYSTFEMSTTANTREMAFDGNLDT